MNRIFGCLVVLSATVTIGCGGYAAIFSAEHFYHVVAKQGTSLVDRPAVLVMYQKSCYPRYDRQERDQHLLFLLHDYRDSTKYIWHDRNAKDSLESQYLTKKSPCLSAFYFKKGEKIQTPTETWTEKDGDLLEWFWWHLKTKIVIQNRYSEAIKITQDNIGNGPELEPAEIAPGHDVTITSYVGYLVQITSSNNVLVDAQLVTDNMTEIVVHEVTGANVYELKIIDENNLRVQDMWVWSHAARHLRNAKQPLLVHNYTETGYAKYPIPPDLYVSMNKFYQSNMKHRHGETVDLTNSVHGKVGTESPHMVQLSEEMKDTITAVIQPQMEEWSHTKLERTAIYGIREYFNGNYLHNHVDRIDTHVISAILQIDQDKGHGKDWMLEVIDYFGKRHQVQLYPGEMLFYESAKLIHGRPQPFQGVRFANAFLHFSPVAGWTYRSHENMIISDKDGMLEPLDQLQTMLTARGDIFRHKDEL